MKDFDAAITRLEHNKPTNTALKRLAASGRLRINFSTVAKEARRSRTLIACADCQYQDQRNRVLRLMHPEGAAAPETRADAVARLRAEVQQLKAKLNAALDGQAAHFLARQRAERDAERWRQEARRRETLLAERDKLRAIIPPG